MVTICPNSGRPVFYQAPPLVPGAQLDGSSYYYTSGYQGIDGNNSRSVSLWIKTSESDSYHLGWGDAGNLWNLGWNAQGPFAETENALGRRQGQGSLSDGQWHHLLISYPGEANLSATRVFLDGERIDLASSIDGVVNTTTSIIPLKVGASSSGGSEMTGWLDEVRVSTVDRDHAWAKYSYQNQKPGASLLTQNLDYLLPPVLPADLNLTVVKGVSMSFEVQ